MIKQYLIADLIWAVISLAIYMLVVVVRVRLAKRKALPPQSFCKHCRTCHRCVWPSRDIRAICIESEYCIDCDAEAHVKAKPSMRNTKRSEA